MNPQARNVAIECTRASDEERVTFGEVVVKLMEVGIERYHADLVRAEKVYYLADGESELVPMAPAASAPALQFSVAAIQSAIKAIQSGEIQYGSFRKRIAESGCVGYMVSLAGKRAVYYGRTGDSYVEWFPDAR